MNLQSILEFLKSKPIITILIVIFLMVGVGLASKSGSDRYYSKYFKEQLQVEKQQIEDKYKQQLENLEKARIKAETDLMNSKVEVDRLSGILNGLSTKETNITTPKTYDSSKATCSQKSTKNTT